MNKTSLRKKYSYSHKRKLQTKVNNFIQENQFTIFNNNPTQKYQKTIEVRLAQCQKKTNGNS
jgi:hypothetical protein